MTLTDIQQIIKHAKHLQIVGNNSQLKSDRDYVLSLSAYAGVLEYHPEELVITVKAGTSIKEIKQTLAEHGQALTFACSDDDNNSIGGVYAIGSPALRDAVLGVKIIDGKGQVLSFGGQVMKNVAGYDVSRLLVGSQGKLAAICEISFKVLPQHYVDIAEINDTEPSVSAISKRIERGLKNIFDPNKVFI